MQPSLKNTCLTVAVGPDGPYYIVFAVIVITDNTLPLATYGERSYLRNHFVH